MAASNPGRMTVCITEAFKFLEDADHEVKPLMKKSTSDTSLLHLKDSADLEKRILRGRDLVKGHDLDIHSQTSLLRDKNDTYTIITYLGDENSKVSRPVHDSGIGTEDLDVSDNFTIVTYLDDHPKNDEKFDSGGSNNDISAENLNFQTKLHSTEESLKNDEVIKRRSVNSVSSFDDTGVSDESEAVLRNHVTGFDKSVEDPSFDENEVIMRSHRKNSDTEMERGSEGEVVMRRQSTNTEEARSRRTQQIVSDAFQFLKDLEYSDRISSYSLNVNDDDTELNINDLAINQNSSMPNLDQDNISSPMSSILSPDNKRIVSNLETSNSDLEKTDILSIEKISQDSLDSDSTDRESVLMRRQRFHRQKSSDSTNQDECTDDSSDEDTALKLDRRKGIYNESFRNSCWLKVDDGLSLSSVQESLEEDNYDPTQSTVDGQSVTEIDSNQQQNKDDVFTNDVSQDYKGHNRSDSVTTTLSESEFQKRYNLRRKCFVKRNDSQQEYHRMSAKIYDNEKTIIIQKSPEDKDFGLHIIDSHPAVITTVDKGSAAHKAGIRQGQILISVNGVNVLECNHEEIIGLVQQNPSLLKVEVANSNFHYIRDLQMPLHTGYMYKQTTSALIKNWKKRYFILRHDNCLYYYKNEKDDDPLGAIPLLNYTVSRHQDNHRDYCFKAEKYQAKTFFFATDTREQLTKWVGAMNEAALLARKRKDSWMDVTSHNVGLPALHIRKPECCGYLNKSSRYHKNFRKRYCVLKDACIYYYKNMNSQSAQGMAHLHGYTVDETGMSGKKFSFTLQPPEPQMRTFYFYVDNETDKFRWMDAMRKSIHKWIKVD